MAELNVVELIQLKKRGQELSPHQLEELIRGYVKNEVEDYQFAAFLMATWFKGMTDAETFQFTESMKSSGKVLDFSHLGSPCVDKHSTGGVGDKTSLIIAPLVAAASVKVPMMAGRGLAHTGGTIDKLESIPGFRVQLSLEEFEKNIQSFGFSIMGQSSHICPADKKIYALRDVTATVDSLPLICASIMSKKLAEGIQALVLDVKFGSGAFMKSLEEARSLALRLKRMGEAGGLKVTAVLSSMSEPLGSFVGNALEVQECIEILQGKKRMSQQGRDLYQDTRDLSLLLSAHMIHLVQPQRSLQDCILLAEELLSSGKAFENFQKMCDFQGPADWRKLPRADHQESLAASAAGYVGEMDVEQIGIAAVELGGGRLKKGDPIDPAVGFEFLVKPGDPIKPGDAWIKIHYNDPKKLSLAKKRLGSVLKVQSHPQALAPLVREIL